MNATSKLVTLFIVITLVIASVGLMLHPGQGYPWLSYFDGWLIKIIRFSIYQALLSAVFTILIALPFSLVLSTRSFKYQWVIKGLLNLFFIMPVLTVILGVVAGFSDYLNVFSLSGILIAHLYLNVPYAIRIYWQQLNQVPANHIRLSQVLAFNRFQRFRFVIFPVLWDATKPIFVLVFLLCFSSFTVVLTLGGGPANTNLEVAIFQALKYDFDPRAAVVYATIHAIIALGIMWLFGRRYHLALSRKNSYEYQSKWPSAAQLVILTVLLSLLIFPFFSLLLNAISIPWVAPKKLTPALFTSGYLAVGSAVVSVILAVSRSLRDGNRLSRMLDFGLLVLPIMAITTGLFLFALYFGVAFKITGLLIIWLNGLMAMPLIVTPLRSRISFFTKAYEPLTKTVGMNQWQQWVFVIWPAIKGIIPWAFTLAIVLSVGDLGIAALIGSAQFVTLPILIYQAMGSYQMVLASQLTLVLLFICFVLLLFAEWNGDRINNAKR